MATTPTKTIKMAIYFENITVGLYILYIFKMHIKFCANKMLFTIQSINLFFMYNFRLQKLEIYTFNWWYSYWSLILWKFCKRGGYKKKMLSNNGFVKIYIK